MDMSTLVSEDPYIKIQPHFAFSLPIQILATGIVLTLVTVLLIHLLFTAQYHWPLERVNYALQLSSVLSLFVTLSSTMLVVLIRLREKSRGWPYMFDYIAVAVPPDDWKQGEKALWYAMEAATSGLAHMTHIQFLTLLYPSALEAQMIFVLLGPLAIASSGMVFTSLIDQPHVKDLGDAIRNICNSTLSLLFTAALLIWGCFVNRKYAWRTDGGTAAFGGGACTLAVLSTLVNFIQIPEDAVFWLPSMLWAVVLWQSFLGWWWWVGSGMGIGEVEDLLQKERERDERKSRKRKRLAASAAAAGGTQDGENGLASQGDNSPNRGLRNRSLQFARLVTLRRRTSHSGDTEVIMEESPEDIQMSAMNHSRHNLQPPIDDPAHTVNDTGSDNSRSDATEPSRLARFFSPVLQLPPFRNLNLAFTRLRHAHLAAARVRAVERVEVRAQVYGVPSGERGGWGLGEFGLRERDDAERRFREFTGAVQEGGLIRNAAGMGAGEGEDDVDEEAGDVGREREIRTGDDERGRGNERGTPSELRQPWWTLWWWGPFRRWRLQDSTTYS